jgi:hypothetical protein
LIIRKECSTFAAPDVRRYRDSIGWDFLKEPLGCQAHNPFLELNEAEDRITKYAIACMTNPWNASGSTFCCYGMFEMAVSRFVHRLRQPVAVLLTVAAVSVICGIVVQKQAFLVGQGAGIILLKSIAVSTLCLVRVPYYLPNRHNRQFRRHQTANLWGFDRKSRY